jgi:glycosyltransferase involved in cell wall biosynthesis
MSRIGIFFPSLAAGGVERIMVTMAREFVRHGHAVDLVVGSKSGEFLSTVPPEVSVYDLRLPPPHTALRLPGLIRYLRQERPAVLLSATDGSNLIALWARRLAGVKTRVVITVHLVWSEHAALESRKGWQKAIKYRFAMPLLMRFSYPWAERVVAVSHGVARGLASVSKLPLDCITVAYNPIVTPDLQEKMQAPVQHEWLTSNTIPVILGVGKLSSEKDFSTLIRAFALVRQHRPARLVILGEGPERPLLEALVQDLGIAQDVALPGFVANPYAWMKRASLFVLSSLFEGLSTVLVEAMAVGTPVVSTDCPGGVREILAEGDYGIIVPRREAAALAEAIRTTLDHPPEAETLQAHASLFSLDTSVTRYLDILGLAH